MADIFPYYAGFSYEWACSQLAAHRVSTSALVLDPWNGSGTTTLAAQANGLRSIGVDLNPIANIVAALRVQANDVTASKITAPDAGFLSEDPAEPLLAWFTPSTAARLRQWARMFEAQPEAPSAVGLVAMFRVVRQLTARFEGSNPTWVRRTSPGLSLVDVDHAKLDLMLAEEQEAVQRRLSEHPRCGASSTLITASASELPIADGSINVILTSPPYLTRIDYAVAYSRELAVMGVDISRDRRLRSKLMGTTLIRSDALSGEQGYGPRATELVAQVAAHPSKASSGYYLKQVRQYLDDLTKSFDELSRVSAEGAILMLVVQDSYYKDIPVPLAEICIEEAVARGWTSPDPKAYEVKRTLTQLNTAARAYAKGKVAETVITLRRG
ncbi:hypothetical protein [Micromonospora chersina]|uniref:hypothetical protein n=1 Tax=Micromonospora chersina TaxID=47854 RepID=UPI00371009B8